jgi:hypothetical protein
MKLTYRGVEHNYNPPQINTKPGQLAGRYRGLDWRFCDPTKAYVQQPTLDLIYRGVTYQNGTTTEAQPVAVPTPVVDRELNRSRDLSRDLIVGHQRAIKNRQQAMLTRLAAEVGLTAREAGSYWNRIQGKIHPSFRETYDRSSAALS